MNVVIGAVLCKIAWTDYQTKHIPDSMVKVLMILTILKECLEGEKVVNGQLLGIFMISIPLLVMSLLIPGSFGGGDIKLMAAGGFLLGGKRIVYAFGIGIFIAGGYIVIKLLKKELSHKSQIALGPALCAGIFLMLFWGEIIEQFIK